MAFYRKAVIEILEQGPKPRYELIKELCPRTMSKKKLQKTLNELEDEGIILNVPRRIGKTHKRTSFYALPKHRYLLEVELDQVTKALKFLRLELCRNPEVEEVAAKVGEDPESVRKLLFKHASELRWKPPAPEEREEAIQQREKVLGIAAQIKYSKEEDIDASEVSVEDIRRAEFVLKHHFDSIKLEHVPIEGVVLFPGSPAPSFPKERTKQEAEEVVKKLSKTHGNK